MPTFYNFTENGVVYNFDDVFVPADLFRDGNLFTWGYGTSGQLGNASTTNRSTPVTTSSGGANWKQVSVGQNHTAAIKTDGTLWTWGAGDSGRLGNATITNTSTPVTTFAGGTNWKQVSASSDYTAAIKTDGTLWTWGLGAGGRLGNAVTTNASTPVTTFAGGTNWKQVSGTLAIKTDGTLWTWGYNSTGQLGTNDAINKSTPVTTFAGGTNWKQVSFGSNHTIAIKTDGTLWTWGSNSDGRLGTNVTTSSLTPVTTFAGGTNWKQVSAASAVAAIKTDGTLWTWGYGISIGQLGRLSAFSYRLTPVTTFAGGTNWADTATAEPEDLYTLSCGQQYTAAIKTDGTLWTWGYGSYGRLGNASTTRASTPVTTFAGGTNWKQVNCSSSTTSAFKIDGRLYTAAIKTDGTLWTWGFGGNGQLGNATAGYSSISTPVTTFAGGTNWKQVSTGNQHTAAIKTNGTLWTWGRNNSGQLGNATAGYSSISTPVTTFAGGTNWKQVSGGASHTAAIKTDGTLWTWGFGGNGQLGNASTTNASTPVTTFAGGTNWKQVSSGSLYTAAIKTDGTLWTWGYGSYGRLGNATAGYSSISTPVTTFAGGTNWKQVNVGFRHMAAVKTDGTLWTWGYNSSGQLGNAATTNVSTPVTTFAGGTNWKQVSCGRDFTAVLRDDGVNKQLFLFGSNVDTTLGFQNTDIIPDQVGGNSTNWKQVNVGFRHMAAVKTDGTLWTWGRGSYGQIGNNAAAFSNPTPVTTFAGGTNWKQVGAGNHTVALTYQDPGI